MIPKSIKEINVYCYLTQQRTSFWIGRINFLQAKAGRDDPPLNFTSDMSWGEAGLKQGSLSYDKAPVFIMTSSDLLHHEPSSSKGKPKLNLLSLGTDIHHRIVHHLLLPSCVGLPYFPQRPCPSALILAMTCRTVQAVVALHFKSDRT